jgi:hypothetical protein
VTSVVSCSEKALFFWWERIFTLRKSEYLRKDFFGRREGGYWQ